MAITEKLQSLGQFEVQLHHSCPMEIQRQLDRYGHLVLTPREMPYRQLTDAQMLAASRYTGIIRGKTLNRSYSPLEKPAPGINDITLSGVALIGHLGDEDDKGAIIETAKEYVGATFAAVVGDLLPASVQAGTINAVAGTYTGTHHLESPRAALDYVCATMGAEYRVNADGTVDAGLAADLYRTTPHAVIVRKPNDRHDPQFHGIPLRAADIQYDVADWTSRVLLAAEGEGDAVIVDSADIAENPYKDLFGNPLVRTRIVNEPETSSTNSAARAQLQLNRFSAEANAFRISIDEFVQEGAFTLGDYVWFYDPPDYIGDGQIMFRGQMIRPVAIRVIGFTWPVSRGMGVYYRTATGGYIDLTPHVRWETSTSEDVELGDFRKDLDTDHTATLLNTRTKAASDGSTPAAPTLTTPFDTSSYTNAEGIDRARIRVAWSTPLNTDGSAVADGDYYEIRWRQTGSPYADFQYSAVSWGVNAFVIDGLEPGHGHDIGVQAVDQYANQSGWSDTTVTSAADTTPPGQPAAPTVTSMPLTLMVEHNLGLNSGGTFNLPDDIDHLDVHVSTSPGFAVSTATLIGVIPATASALALQIGVIASFPVSDNAARYVKVVAVDRAGNESTPSPEATDTADLVDAQHIASAAIGTAKIADLAVTSAKIDSLAVTNAKIGSLAVTSAKINDVSAAKITAGNIGVAQHIRSSNYVAGSTGWEIDGAGDAEFNNVTVRGTVTGSTITSTYIRSDAAADTEYLEIDDGDINFRDGANRLIGDLAMDANQDLLLVAGRDITGTHPWSSLLQLPSSDAAYALPVALVSYGTRYVLIESSHDLVDVIAATDVIVSAGDDISLDAAGTVILDGADVTRGVDIVSSGGGDIRIWATGGTGADIDITTNSGGDIFLAAANDTIAVASDDFRISADTIIVRNEVGSEGFRFTQTSSYCTINNSNSGTFDTMLLLQLNGGDRFRIEDNNLSNGRSLLSSVHPSVSGRPALKMSRQSTSGSENLQARNSADSAYRDMLASAFTINSDRRNKQDIAPVDPATRQAMRTVEAIQYRRIDDESGRLRLGFAADDLPAAAVVTDDDGELLYDSAAVMALAWDEIRELRAEVDLLKAGGTT